MLLFAPIKWGYRLVKISLTVVIIYVIVSAVQVVHASNVPSVPRVMPASPVAIAVMVTASSNTTLNADTTNRLEEALLLHNGQDSRRIVIVQIGTRLAGNTDPAASRSADQSLESSAKFLMSQGVPRRYITKIASGSVDAGLVDLSGLLSSNYHVIIVTDSINALWIAHAAAAARLKASVVRPAASNRLFVFELGSLWRQATGIAAARIIGYSHTTWVNG